MTIKATIAMQAYLWPTAPQPTGLPTSQVVCTFGSLLLRQRVVRFQSSGSLTSNFILSAGAIPRQRGLYGIQEVLIAKWFRQERHGARLDGAERH